MSDSKPVNAPRQFAAHFHAVCTHYQCTPDEIEIMKQLARRDMANAVVSFAAMAREISEIKE